MLREYSHSDLLVKAVRSRGYKYSRIYVEREGFSEQSIRDTKLYAQLLFENRNMSVVWLNSPKFSKAFCRKRE